jgi:hypothetical protein
MRRNEMETSYVKLDIKRLIKILPFQIYKFSKVLNERTRVYFASGQTFLNFYFLYYLITVRYSTVQYSTRFQARGEAECLISWSAGKYLPYDICIRFFGWPNVLFCTFANFNEITNVKLFDVQRYQPDRLCFPYYYYNY